MKNIGYIIAIALEPIFVIVSVLLGFRTQNCVLAAVWLYAMIISAFTSAYLNVKSNKKILHRILFGLMIYAFVILTIILLVSVLNPNIDFPLY
ncbi:MAG: hypothetical protein LUC50_05010 [Ruminococcus sp.]|nr:hypothetical protein [Ruminococcus sp.]